MKQTFKYIIGTFILWILLGYLLLLSGCAKTTDPITEINSGIQQSISELVDYANNNMVMDTDKQMLLNGAKDCAARADAMTHTYEVSIERCQANQDKLKLERNGLILIIVLLLFFMFRGSLKNLLSKFLPL